MGQHVELDAVTMRFGDFTAVRNVSMRIEAGEFFAILGPSGCGKTTLLRLISGFMEPSAGQVRIGGKDMRGTGPNGRPTALIFQNLALFPLMSVGENIGFGLEVRGLDRAQRRRRVDDLLRLVALDGAADKRVGELSGGQKQRVAIARALAVEPEVMLLDEPLSALDLKLRQHMRGELRTIQKATGVTFIYITHDQGEALTMADRVAVMSAGVVQQVDVPAVIYDRPSTAFVASFVGEMNAFSGTVAGIDGGLAAVDTPAGRLVGQVQGDLGTGSEATLYVRPERLRLPADGHANHLAARISHVDFEGSFANLFLTHGSGLRLMVQVTNDGRLGSLPDGGDIEVGFASEQAVVLPAAPAASA